MDKARDAVRFRMENNVKSMSKDVKSTCERNGNSKAATARRATPRNCKLEPLSSPKARTALSIESTERERDRLEESTNDFHSGKRELNCSSSPKKRFGRLETIESMVQRHVQSMQHGEFVSRSVARWHSKELRHGEQSDASCAFRVIRDSSATVIQCCYRNHLARCLMQRIRMDVFATQLAKSQAITKYLPWLQHLTKAFLHERRLVKLRESMMQCIQQATPPTANTSIISQSLTGVYAWLPSMQILFTIRLVLILQQTRRVPSISLLFELHVHKPVHSTLHSVARLWRQVASHSAITIQCAFRCYMARKIVVALRRTRIRNASVLMIQCMARCFLARRLVYRIRRHRATLRIQCGWRVHMARQIMLKRRCVHRAELLVAHYIGIGWKRAFTKIVDRAATTIQKYVKGFFCRNLFRQEYFNYKIRQNYRIRNFAQRGIEFFFKKNYLHAAVWLEAGFVEGLLGSLHLLQKKTTSSKLNETSSRSVETLLKDPELMVWLVYAWSHLLVYESRGQLYNLQRAQLGFDTFLKLGTIEDRQFYLMETMLSILFLETRFLLVQTTFWLEDYELTLKLTDELQFLLSWIQSHHRRQTVISNGQVVKSRAALDAFANNKSSELTLRTAMWLDQLVWIQSLCYFHQNQLTKSFDRLETHLMDDPQPAQQQQDQEQERNLQTKTIQLTDDNSSAADNEVGDGKSFEKWFMLVFFLWKQETQRRLLAKSMVVRPPLDPASQVNDSFGLSKLRFYLQKCYQLVELWPGVGFFHGVLSETQVSALLERAPVGAFLVHQIPQQQFPASGVVVNSMTNAGNPQVPSPPTQEEPFDRNCFYLRVKLAKDKVTSLKILFSPSQNLFASRKCPESSHFSLHGFLQRLPSVAGLVFGFGIRKKLLRDELVNHLAPERLFWFNAMAMRRQQLLEFDHWQLFDDTMDDQDKYKKTQRLQVWSSLCLEASKRLYTCQAFGFSQLIAVHCLETLANDRVVRAEAAFLAGRAAFADQKRHQSFCLFQQGKLLLQQSKSMVQKAFGDFSAIHKALFASAIASSSMAAGSTEASKQLDEKANETFPMQIKRFQKIDRMLFRAWQFYTFAPFAQVGVGAGVVNRPGALARIGGVGAGGPCEPATTTLDQRLACGLWKESLLLQRIDDELFYQSDSDVFFLQMLWRIHLRNFVLRGNFQAIHCQLAFEAVQRVCRWYLVSKGTGRVHHDLRNVVLHLRGIRFDEKTMVTTQSINLQNQFGALVVALPRLPLQTCLEIGEVVYRMGMALNQKIRLLESIWKRLQHEKPVVNAIAYSGFEHLLMLRLAFLWFALDVEGVAAAAAATALNDRKISTVANDGGSSTMPVARDQPKAKGALWQAIQWLTRLVDLRKRRENTRWMWKPMVWPVRINWKELPSEPEILFLRGLLEQRLEQTQQRLKLFTQSPLCSQTPQTPQTPPTPQTPQTRERRAPSSIAFTSERDFSVWHQQLLDEALPKMQHEQEYRQSVQFLSQHLKGIRVHIGATTNLNFDNIFKSRPEITIKADGRFYLLQTLPNWNTMCPCWDEFVNIDTRLPKSRLRIVLKNKDRRKQSLGDGQSTMGVVEVFTIDILQNKGRLEPKWYELKPLTVAMTKEPANNNNNNITKSEAKGPPQIMLGFQAILNEASNHSNVSVAHLSRPCSCAGGLPVKKQRGWQRLVQVPMTCMTTERDEFCRNPLVWSVLANRLLRLHDHLVASVLLDHALKLTQSLPVVTQQQNLIKVETMVSLSTCYRALAVNDVRLWPVAAGDNNSGPRAPLGQKNHFSMAKKLLEDAKKLFEAHFSHLVDESAVYAEIVDSLDKFFGDPTSGPTSGASFTPEGSSDSTNPSGALLHATTQAPARPELLDFAAERAKNIAASSVWIKTSAFAAWDSDQPESPAMYFFNKDTGEKSLTEPLEYEPQDDTPSAWTNLERRHRIVLYDNEMKRKLTQLRKQMKLEFSRDPEKWMELYDESANCMVFVSRKDPHKQSTQRPDTYVMVVDEFTLYNVLVLQRAVRTRIVQRKRRRTLRMAMCMVRYCVNELTQARKRIFDRAENKRKHTLNCVHLVLHKAERLRDPDLPVGNPYVEIHLTLQEDAKTKSSVRKATNDPKWNEEFFIRYEFADHEQVVSGHRVQLTNGGAVRSPSGQKRSNKPKNPHGVNKTKPRAVNPYIVFTLYDFDLEKQTSDFMAQCSLLIEPLASGVRQQLELPLLEEDDEEIDTAKLSIEIQWIAHEFPAPPPPTPPSAQASEAAPSSSYVPPTEKTVELSAAAQPKPNDTTTTAKEGFSVNKPGVSTDAKAPAKEPQSSTPKRKQKAVKSPTAAKKPPRVDPPPIVRPRTPLPKPQFTKEMEMVVLAIHKCVDQSVLQFIEINRLVEPLQKLSKRYGEAQSVGKTAEEAKLVEQRLESVVKLQLNGLLEMLRQQLVELQTQLTAFDHRFSHSIDEYVKSLENTALLQQMEQLFQVTRSVPGLQQQLDSFPVVHTSTESSTSTSGSSPPPSTTTKPSSASTSTITSIPTNIVKRIERYFQWVVKQKQTLQQVEQQFAELLATFVDKSQWQMVLTKPPPGTAQPSSPVHQGSGGDGGSSTILPAQQGATGSTNPPPSSPTSKTAGGASAVEKRLQRIQRESKKRK